MADELEDLTTRILRQVQETQAEQTRMLAKTRCILENQSRIVEDHGRMLRDHSLRFESFGRLLELVAERVSEIQNAMITTIAYAPGADATQQANARRARYSEMACRTPGGRERAFCRGHARSTGPACGVGYRNA
jgi:hypothetical protein